MSECLNKPKLIAWLESEMEPGDNGYEVGYRTAMKWVAYQLMKGAFDSSEIEQLQSDNAKMRDCLEWYGDKETYLVPNITDYTVERVVIDGGKRARECLSKLGSGSDA